MHAGFLSLTDSQGEFSSMCGVNYQNGPGNNDHAPTYCNCMHCNYCRADVTFESLF